jgi:hypothetical protein
MAYRGNDSYGYLQTEQNQPTFGSSAAKLGRSALMGVGAATGLGAAGMKLAPKLAGKALRSGRTWHPRIQRGAENLVNNQKRLSSAADSLWLYGAAPGAAAGLAGAGSLASESMGDFRRSTQRPEAGVGGFRKEWTVVKGWRDHVSDNAKEGHRYLVRNTVGNVVAVPAALAGGALMTKRRTLPAGAVLAGAAGLAYTDQAKRAARWGARARVISDKGRERERVGLSKSMLRPLSGRPTGTAVVRASPGRRGYIRRTVSPGAPGRNW